MNTILLIAALVGQGPFSAAVKQATPEQPAANWNAVPVAGVTIELPVPTVIETKAFERTAPANYKAHAATKRVPRWCSARPEWKHGYSCGMSTVTEDLLGHLQEVHEMPLELANQLGRAKWQDYHTEQHWCEETAAKQESYLHPKPAKTGCASGNCPSGNCGQDYTYGRSRGFF